MNKKDKLKGAVETYFRNLDTTDTSIFYSLQDYCASIRSKCESFSQDEKGAIYGTLAEEVAYYLLRMYQAHGHPIEIVHSLLFEYNDKKETTEIDLIAVTPNMVYVIEVKHRSDNIKIKEDGTFVTKHGEQSPISQNVNHIRKLFQNAGYGNLVTPDRVLNIVFLLLNDCKVTNPVTLFKKDNLNGAFAGQSNLLPLIHKFENEKSGGRIPYKVFADSIRKLDLGKGAMDKHINNLNKKYNK